MPILTVGKLREQTALCSADTEVVLVGADALEVIDAYPDTTDNKGDWIRSFKIVVQGELHA